MNKMVLIRPLTKWKKLETWLVIAKWPTVDSILYAPKRVMSRKREKFLLLEVVPLCTWATFNPSFLKDRCQFLAYND